MMNLNIYFIYDLCDFQKQETKGIDTYVKISKVIDTQENGDIKWFSLSEMKSERCNYDLKMFIKQQKFLENNRKRTTYCLSREICENFLFVVILTTLNIDVKNLIKHTNSITWYLKFFNTGSSICKKYDHVYSDKDTIIKSLKVYDYNSLSDHVPIVVEI